MRFLVALLRFNVSHLEQWIHENKLETSEAVATLQPIVQASQLLQARKEIEDVTAVCDICTKLSAQQALTDRFLSLSLSYHGISMGQ